MNSHTVWNSQNDGSAPQQPAYGGAPGRDQPEYGQYKEPEYGEMASRYPGWNPYVYGAPEPDADGDDGGSNDGESGRGRKDSGRTNPMADRFGYIPGGRPADQARGGNGPAGPGGPNGYRGPNDQNGPNGAGGSGNRNGIDLDDPNQNPLYGRWDPAAIIGFVTALLNVPVLPLLLCGLAIYRTKTFRMKGRTLAIIGMVLAVLDIIIEVYMLAAGIDVYQLLSQLYGIDFTGGSGGGTSV
ncbi:hypothetical protein KIH77_00530 [Bifidobacterium sp. 82T24]|uniref:hypothetical protein n=1 Tax=Bifidobacterium pluvialisilvae TaxID=2834436 RepID=UPI001C58E881|nr:hypothetical protein [Bifidobacterium pluvialisilvae]MBW3087230.1 hypothetical protein [Bifidobacterium pluvialisilvae]